MENSVLLTEPYMLPGNILELEKTNIRLWIDLDVKLMYTEWLLRPSAEEYRETVELMIHMVSEYAVACWIAESRMLSGMPIDVQKSILQQLAPLLKNSTLKKLARIIEKDSHSNYMFQDLSNKFRRRHRTVIEVEQFISFEDAADWVSMIRA